MKIVIVKRNFFFKEFKYKCWKFKLGYEKNIYIILFNCLKLLFGSCVILFYM